MISTDISPHDIQSPLGVPRVYEKILQGDSALVLAVLVNVAQKRGSWNYSDSFPPRYADTLRQMVRDGILLEKDTKYIPSPEVIDQLVKFYPSRN